MSTTRLGRCGATRTGKECGSPVLSANTTNEHYRYNCISVTTFIYLLRKLSLRPVFRFGTHFDGGVRPVLAVIVAFVRAGPETSALQRLLLSERGQHAKDNRSPGVELHAHKSVGDRVADVLEVHSRALNERANGDNRIEGARGHLRGGPKAGRAGKQVARADGCFGTRSRDHPSRRQRRHKITVARAHCAHAKGSS